MGLRAGRREKGGMMATQLLTAPSPRFPEECGVWGALSLCQHVDGAHVLLGGLRHHGHLCE